MQFDDSYLHEGGMTTRTIAIVLRVSEAELQSEENYLVTRLQTAFQPCEHLKTRLAKNWVSDLVEELQTGPAHSAIWTKSLNNGMDEEVVSWAIAEHIQNVQRGRWDGTSSGRSSQPPIPDNKRGSLSLKSTSTTQSLNPRPTSLTVRASSDSGPPQTQTIAAPEKQQPEAVVLLDLGQHGPGEPILYSMAHFKPTGADDEDIQFSFLRDTIIRQSQGGTTENYGSQRITGLFGDYYGTRVSITDQESLIMVRNSALRDSSAEKPLILRLSAQLSYNNSKKS